MRAGFGHRTGTVAVMVAIGISLAACKDNASEVAPPATTAPAAPVAPPATVAPPPVSPAPVPAPMPAPAAPAQQAPAAATATPKKVSMSVQGVSPSGVTVRVKGIEIGADATVVDVSISFANRINASTMLAMADTFLEDENHNRLQIKRPDSNRNLTLRQGETLDGQLVFLGAVPASARKLRLVFNDGYQEDNIVAPGLAMELPLQGS
ncbi:hypothetical protein H9K75_05505 [Diaphorobacter aerolatus]|uniref:DUF4352 domain-containing protein n=2 Tax=Diaphorobacter aerolatus TaxID=1288495 RepID=A0A7H0GQ52_9BURK|nr:hypothetical protein H9K75_05505 [Diaphorobacter aerolatus]